MTQEAETVAMDLNIVSCQTCDALFIESERRQTCPSCGGPPVGPYFQFVLDGDGLHRKDGAMVPLIDREEAVQRLKDLGYPAEEAEARAAEWDKEEAAAAEAAPATAPVEEEAPAEEKEEATDLTFGVDAGLFVYGRESITEDTLRQQLTDLGADPEAAATAVGRLVAVRDLLRELAEIGVEAQVEVAAEETPGEAPEPSPEPESAPETS